VADFRAMQYQYSKGLDSSKTFAPPQAPPLIIYRVSNWALLKY